MKSESEISTPLCCRVTARIKIKMSLIKHSGITFRMQFLFNMTGDP